MSYAPTLPAPRQATLGLAAVFGSTFFELVAHFMLMPMLLLGMKESDVSSTVAGLFSAAGWLGIFTITPFASAIAHRLGQRASMWLAASVLTAVSMAYAFTDNVAWWFALNLVSGLAMALRWVLAEALIAEFCPAHLRGRYVGFFQTLVSATFIIGPAALAWMGTSNPSTLHWAIGFSAFGLAWTALIPRLPVAHDTHTATTGWTGLWAALRAHPIIMMAGFVGGFFETGVTGILPLYGLELGLSATQAALLVSVSGIGGVALMLPAGMVADHFANPALGRRRMMVVCASVMLLATCTPEFDS